MDTVVRRPRGVRLPKKELTMAEYLASESEWGGTELEKLVDGAAKEMGIRFDAAQYFIPLSYGAEYTKVDRVIFSPPIAVFIDGYQHDLRPEIEQRDTMIGMELRGRGWQVIRLHWKALIISAQNEVAKIKMATFAE